MDAFEYARPNTTQGALQLLGSSWGETEVLAGGTDLISAMKNHITTPRRVVSLQRIKGLNRVEYHARAGLRLGPLARIQDLLDNKIIREHYRAIYQAADGIRGEQMRHMGTVGGELLQRPRCWYFRNGYGLLAQYQGKSLVPDGQNRYHAILGNSGPAYFVNASCLAPALIALGAKVRLHGPGGEREVELGKFYITPTRDGEREYVLKPNEILTEILVPARHGVRTATYEVREKEGLDWPLVTATVALHLDGDTVRSARVVMGHVAPVPWPSAQAEHSLAGKRITEEVADQAGKAAVSKATPLSQNGYKVRLAHIAVKRAILSAVKGES